MEKSLQNIDFLAIGDMVTDAFIELADAQVSCDINNENCTISMRFGDKIPYRDVHVIHAVGNSPNASVSAKRLGLTSAILAKLGDDETGTSCIAAAKDQGIITDYLAVESGKKTNYHYVLQYGAERTILVKHEDYNYHLPESLTPPAWMYLSSIAQGTESFHEEIASYLEKNPEIKLAFQPGTFQMKMGVESLKNIYQHTYLFLCNKEEAQRILQKPHADFPELHAGIRALGPRLIVITDGPKGLTASDEAGVGYFVPMYPDPKPPVDRTGAGDACSSTIVTALQLGIPFDQALLWGPINSMSVVQYIGAQKGLLSREKIETFLAEAPDNYKTSKLF